MGQIELTFVTHLANILFWRSDKLLVSTAVVLMVLRPAKFINTEVFRLGEGRGW